MMRIYKCILFLFLATAVTTASETRQYEAYLNKPYAETMDSMHVCFKRFEAAELLQEDLIDEWNKIKAFATKHHDKRLELCVDFFLW